MINIYVGNLPFNTAEADLSDLFSQHGEVAEVQIIMDRDTGKSRGFGFVKMANDQAGRDAIEAINGHEMGGRHLVVNEARPRTERAGGGRPRGR